MHWLLLLYPYQTAKNLKNSLYLNGGDAMEWTQMDITSDEFATLDVQLADFDRDGDLDLITGDQGCYSYDGYFGYNHLYRNDRYNNPFDGIKDPNAPTDTPTATNTPTWDPSLETYTPTPSPTNLPTNTPTLTPSAVNTPTPSPTETNSPTVTPTPTDTATITATPTSTSTVTPTDTPTITPTNTPRPNNHPPKFVTSPSTVTVTQGEIKNITFIVTDEDGDNCTFELSDETIGQMDQPAYLSMTKQSMVNVRLETSTAGEYVFSITAYDGSDPVSHEVKVSVIESTPTPTPTPEWIRNTPKPDNNPPEMTLKYNAKPPEDMFKVEHEEYIEIWILQSSELKINLTAKDNEGDNREVHLSSNAPAEWTSISNIANYTYATCVVDTSQTGYYPFLIHVYDGSDITSQEIRLTVSVALPSPTPMATPTNTPTPSFTPINTNTPTATSIPTMTPSETAKNTPTETSTPTNTPSPTPSATSTNTATPTPSQTEIPTPSQTPTPTSTHTPIPLARVVVYDGEMGAPDITGETDFDAVDDRNLTLSWNATGSNANDWHLYIRKGLGGMKFLGRTGDGLAEMFHWRQGTKLLNSDFSGGPDFNSVYSFRAVRIDGQPGADDYFNMLGLVGFNLEGGNPVVLSQPEMPNLQVGNIAVYDGILGGKNLAPTDSSGSDTDPSSSRAIQIAWNFGHDSSEVNQYLLLVSVDGGDYAFLGQTYDGNITYFWWTPNNEFSTHQNFADGPQDGKSYRFKVKMLPVSGTPEFLTSGTLEYHVSDEDSQATGEASNVFIYDNENTTADLSGQTDFDSISKRDLTIAWDAEQGTATDWHVYLRKGLGGAKYLGRTKSETATHLNWTAGAPFLGNIFANGPDFNSAYTFRVVRIDDERSSDDYLEAQAPVGFNLEGGNEVSLSQPENPNLEADQIVVYDDILGGDNLAPMDGSGSDTDQPGSRAIQIAWNFGRDLATVNDYHVLVSVDGGEYQYLGQTYAGNIPYFWWTPNSEFTTNALFADGPQDEHRYRFMVYLIPLSGTKVSLTSGELDYSVGSKD